MSETAPERTPPRSSGSNVFTRRIGPLPMWQWLSVGAGIIAVYVIYEYRKKNKAGANAANQAGGAGTGGTVGAGQVPQFVNQTYTTVTPPVVNVPPPSTAVTPPPSPAASPPPQPSTAPAPSPSKPSALPNLRGLTLANALQAAQQAGWQITNVSSGSQNLTAQQIQQAAAAGRTIYSYTPYPQSSSVRVGLM